MKTMNYNTNHHYVINLVVCKRNNISITKQAQDFMLYEQEEK